jgi:glycosyltransferase involved in cell wall biosynthesis
VRVVRVITRLNRGGPLRQLEALVPGLAGLGIDGPVLAGEVPRGEDDGTVDLERAGVRVVSVPGLLRGVSPFADARALRWIRAFLATERPDVVHTHTAKAGALGRVAARRARVPAVVHTFHGHHFDAGGLAARAARFAERRLAPLTSCAVCLSPRQRDDLVTRHAIFDAVRVVVIPPLIDVAAFHARAAPDVVAATRARHARAGETVLLWLGRHVAAKDPLLLVEAFARARASNPALRLWLVGDGPLRASVAARVATLRIAAHVTDVGPVADSAPFVGAADALVLASRSEGTPVAILEAQALQIPVVATRVGGVPDLVPSGGAGTLTPPGDVDALAGAMASVTVRVGPQGRSPDDPVAPSASIALHAALYRRLLASADPALPATR